MSYASEKQRTNPATLGAAIIFNGAIVLAVALSPVIVETVLTPPVERPPIYVGVEPQPKPDPKPQPTDTRHSDPVDHHDPIADAGTTDMGVTTSSAPTGSSTADDGAGSDIGGTALPPPVVPKPIFHKAERDPRFASNFQPDYPAGLLQKEIEGSVKIKVLIGADGRVRQAIVLSASRPDFGKAAERQALREWRFKPATRDGVAVEDWQTLTVTFTINS